MCVYILRYNTHSHACTNIYAHTHTHRNQSLNLHLQQRTIWRTGKSTQTTRRQHISLSVSRADPQRRRRNKPVLYQNHPVRQTGVTHGGGERETVTDTAPPKARALAATTTVATARATEDGKTGRGPGRLREPEMGSTRTEKGRLKTLTTGKGRDGATVPPPRGQLTALATAEGETEISH